MKACFKILVVLLSFMNAAHAATMSGPLVDNALRLTLNRPGFDLLNGKLRDEFLNDIVDQPIDDFEQDLGYGIQGHFTGLSYSIDFRDVRVLPAAGYIDTRMEFNQIRVHSDKIRFQKKSGIDLKTTCEDTTMIAGLKLPIYLRMKLVPQAVNGLIVLEARDVEFAIPDEEYEVDGPRKCSGSLGIGNVMRFALNRALAKANDRISSNVRERIRTLAPDFASQLNELLQIEIPFKIGGSGIIPPAQLYVSAKPWSIEVNPTSTRFSLSVDIRSKEDVIWDDAALAPRLGAFNDSPVVASLGIRPELVNELVQHVLPLMPQTLEVDTNQGVLKDVFNRQGLSAILPDLNQIVLDDDRILARIGFAQLPRLETRRGRDGSIELNLVVPDMHVLLDITQNGQRVPYFDLKFAILMGIRLELTGDTLRLMVVPPGGIQVTGQWAPTYHPVVDIFEQDVAQLLFSSVMDYLFAAGPLASFKVPVIQVDERTRMKVVYPFIEDGFISAAFSVDR